MSKNLYCVVVDACFNIFEEGDPVDEFESTYYIIVNEDLLTKREEFKLRINKVLQENKPASSEIDGDEIDGDIQLDTYALNCTFPLNNILLKHYKESNLYKNVYDIST